jgi:hypothetical protein
MRLKQTVIASALALSAATGVAVASVGGDEPADDPERATGAVTARAEPVREGAGTARILVTREAGAPARLTWATRPNTAAAGADFEPARGLVQFEPEERTTVLEVEIRADDVPEDAETFDVRLDAAPGVDAAMKPAVTTVVIRG